jgi:hypothetical protein
MTGVENVQKSANSDLLDVIMRILRLIDVHVEHGPPEVPEQSDIISWSNRMRDNAKYVGSVRGEEAKARAAKYWHLSMMIDTPAQLRA